MQFSLITLAALAASTAQAAHSITLYEQKSYGGKSFPFSTNGVHSLGGRYLGSAFTPYTAQSYKFSSNDGCCVHFCYKGVDKGYRCSSSNQPTSSSLIDKVVIGCTLSGLKC
ncbi:hypothetical protein CLAFUW4_11985 [Fulvia fulva]|uniref:Uncharacterized protein n=1 Tax=Passalora fulva TaxID=5499 RepID=A0A9Q8PE91_PASFU|nr:uncharacterized protein CLAFUR5_11026 [Fulvia fulva]KAK4618231.1 hypothetical protein CLAFUR4_11990 [Fulvia fulva]KAK4619176.1 hypothetical protein CLAFUR0_12001 [Fulvia fulva]UJO20839.1 hypothetical protein CLAFUR5_11026 [Fulvia fulva]WPV18673.1 hypothetical protein CLAFUW4_11985 [Fulvia fulva]WPV33141.1 hypothetical protein CLAFUW7_11992 [Fulvia fulva]